VNTLIVPRGNWEQPGYPVTGPSSTPAQWAYNTLHWPGADVNVNDPVGTLQGMQRSWVNNKGYSLGYNFAVFPNGVAYEIRGFDIRCAANGNQEVNCPAVAVLLAVPSVNSGPPSNEMTQAVQDIVAATRSQVGRYLAINGHRDVRPEPTQCPGENIYNMITAGVFEPDQDFPSPTGDGMVFRTNQTGDAVFSQGSDMNVRYVNAQEGYVAEATQPGWASSAPTINVPNDVADWLNSMVE
jgi:hypothetical protein